MKYTKEQIIRSAFGGIPRNWKRITLTKRISATAASSSPFGGIPRNWKQRPLGSLGNLYGKQFIIEDRPFPGGYR
jgi:hypothetical protein